MRSVVLFLFMLMSSIGMTQYAQAHQLSTGYLSLTVDDSAKNRLNGQLQLRLYDLELSVGIDNNADGQLHWQEVTMRNQALITYIDEHLTITSQDRQCQLQPRMPMQFDRHFDQGFLVVNFISNCQQEVGANPLTIKYDAIFEQESDHKLVLNIDGYAKQDGQLLSLVLDSHKRQQILTPNQSYLWETVSTYLYQGIVHILIGLDHIVFLLLLLMSCVLYRRQGTWLAHKRLIPVLKSAAWIVTAFTLAHSITLTASALGWVTFNTRWIEVGIALSVLITALNNVWPILLRLGWLTFAFGLLHGMGFASVLSELGLSAQHQLASIVAFNVGVEIGQLMILGVFLPLFYFLSRFGFYRWLILRVGSLGIGLVALNWAVQRL